MYKCKFKFSHNNCWLVDVSKKFPQLTFIDNAAYVKPNGDLMDVCFIKGNSKYFKKVIKFLRSHKSVLGVRTVERGKDYLFLQVIGNRKTMFFTTLLISKHNCFRIGDVIAKNGYEKWVIGAPKKSDINNLVLELKKYGKITSKHITKAPAKIVDLTKKQERALALAYYNNFYNIPRGIDLKKLASEIGVNKSTFREHLKSAERKIIRNYLEE